MVTKGFNLQYKNREAPERKVQNLTSNLPETQGLTAKQNTQRTVMAKKGSNSPNISQVDVCVVYENFISALSQFVTPSL